MLFSVIYSADIPSGVSVRDYAPPQARRLWQQTESGPSEYSYLEGRWERGKHRKWAALLDREQFDEFVNTLGLYAESTETMGSFGAPGFGFGWSPAISFTSDDEDAILNAYVTPLPEVRNQGGDERCCPCTAEIVFEQQQHKKGPTTMSSIPEVTLGNWTNEVLQHDGPVLVDFYSPTCGPCRMQTPILEELAKERPDLKIVKLDVSENLELAVHHGIAAVPTLMLVRNGQVVDRLRGLQNRDRLVYFLENSL